jgi:serine/threonine protein kinase
MIESGTFLQQRYRIDKQIGQGGMGAVYVATDERFNSIVAIKETLCMDENFRKAIEREARLLNSLKHSALPRVSDHFEENAGQFLVMEYIQGEDLHNILEREKRPFPVATVLQWADQLLDALDYLHTQNDPVIHRDIKPQNLKVTARGQAILLDFGLAKGNPTGAGHNTAAKSIFGYSRNYASIEQIQGTGTDPRSDLYSLAATLYHLLTNTPPDDALTRAMSVLSNNGDPLRPANLIDPSIPAGVAGVLHKSLALNAADRPSSAAEMRKMLREHQKYTDLADVAANTVVMDTGAAGRPTHLTPGETQPPPFSGQTDVKTEILPVPLSQVTSLRSDDVDQKTNAYAMRSAPSPIRRRIGVPAIALLLLLVGGAAAGGLYMMDPAIFGAGTAEKAVDQPSSVPPSANAAPLSNTDTSQLLSGSTEVAPDANAVQAETSRQTGAANKTGETTRNGKTAQSAKGKNTNDAGDDADVTMNDGDVPEEMVITQRDRNGKLRTIHVNPKFRPPNVPNVPSDQYYPFPPGFDPGKEMTPAERRQLREFIRKQNANVQPKN